MVLAHNQVIARKGDVWLPTSVHFRDPDHYRRTLARLAGQGEPPFTPGRSRRAAIDVRLANGFRVVAVLPPAVLDQPPVAVFVRGPGRELSRRLSEASRTTPADPAAFRLQPVDRHAAIAGPGRGRCRRTPARDARARRVRGGRAAVVG